MADVGAPVRAMDERVTIADGDASLEGTLEGMSGARGVVAFAHGSGSGRHSPRNRLVAEALKREGLATLLIDLLAPREQESRDLRFDIPLLARRLALAVRALRSRAPLEGLALGLYGASTGAAAALRLAADPSAAIAAVVSRGGRPDLAEDALPRVTAPTLLVVGGLDTQVLELNRRALDRLGGEAELSVVPGATHLFEEPGALEQVAMLACDWFVRHVAGARAPDGAA